DARARLLIVLAAAGIAEMPPRFTPETRLQRRLGEGDMALEVILMARGKRLETLQALQRPFIGKDRVIGRGELGMRRVCPRGLDHLARLACLAGSGQHLRITRSGLCEAWRQRLRFGDKPHR